MRRLISSLIRYTTTNNNNNSNNSKQDKILRDYDYKINQLRKQKQIATQTQTSSQKYKQKQTSTSTLTLTSTQTSSVQNNDNNNNNNNNRRYKHRQNQTKNLKILNKQQQIKQIVNQTRNKLKQAQQQNDLNKIKSYLMEGIADNTNTKTNNNNNSMYGQQQQNTTQNDKSYIPNNMVLKKLKFLNKKILLIGVQQQNEDHCIYLKQIAQKMQTNVILTALPPDMPYFIKTQQSFYEQWKKFVSNSTYTKQSKFYVNPTPKNIAQFCLNKTQIQLIRSSLNKSPQFNQIFYTILQKSQKTGKYLPNALLTPLLVSTIQRVYICDYPLLKQRQFWALNVGIQKMRELFQIYHKQLFRVGKQKMIFDPRILFPKQTINRKFQHMANAIKYVSCTTQKPTIFVCPAQYSEMLCEQFKKDRTVSQYTYFKQNIIPSALTQTQIQTPFIEYVQKLVIMDLILEPILQKYFIKNVSFPYQAKQTLGGRQNIGRIFIVWRHFYNMYTDALRKQPSSSLSPLSNKGRSGIAMGQDGSVRNRQAQGNSAEKLRDIFQ